jgi:HEAT repeat protein
VRTVARVHATPSGSDFDAWVALLARPARRQAAKRHLRGCGARAVPAIRRGLHHDSAEVRRLCVNLLDALVDEDAVPDLVEAIGDPDPMVVGRALHALACDACKQNECRPNDDLFVPKALDLARTSTDADVRAMAIDALGKAAERNPTLLDAIADATAQERDPGLRGMVRRVLQR